MKVLSMSTRHFVFCEKFHQCSYHLPRRPKLFYSTLYILFDFISFLQVKSYKSTEKMHTIFILNHFQILYKTLKFGKEACCCLPRRSFPSACTTSSFFLNFKKISHEPCCHILYHKKYSSIQSLPFLESALHPHFPLFRSWVPVMYLAAFD